MKDDLFDPEFKKGTSKFLGWYFYNFLFATIPLLCAVLALPASFIKANAANTVGEIKELMEAGILNFAFIAIMGSVWVDYKIEFENGGQYPKLSSWEKFIIFYSPLILSAIVMAAYVLTSLKVWEEDYFIKFSWTQTSVLFSCFMYTFIFKVNTFIKEDK
jgi:hypothetical protein